MPSVYLLTAHLIDQSSRQGTIHHYVTSAHPGFPVPAVQVTFRATWNLEVNKSYHSSSPQTCVRHSSKQHSLQVCETEFYLPMPSALEPTMVTLFSITPQWACMLLQQSDTWSHITPLVSGHPQMPHYCLQVCPLDCHYSTHQSACKLCNIVTYSIHLQHLSHRSLVADNRLVPPLCHVPGTWSLHKAPHKIMFSDRIQLIAETISTTKPFMATVHHLGLTCKFIMVASTLHTNFLSHMPQISLLDRHKYNYACFQPVWETSLTQTNLLSPEHIPYRQTIP